MVIHIPGELNLADYATRPWSGKPRPLLNLNESLTILRHLREQPGHSCFVPGREPHAVSKKPTTTQDVETVLYMRLRKRKTKLSEETTNKETTNKETTNEETTNEETTNEEPNEDEEYEELEEDLQAWNSRVKNSQKTINITTNMTIDQEGIIRDNDRIVLPNQDHDLIQRTMKRIHDRKHQGISATRVAIRRHYIWKNMDKDINRFVKDCGICQTARTNRTVRTTTGHALQLQDIERIPIGSIIGIDIMTIEAQKEGSPSCIITCTCLISKWVRALPLTTQLSNEIVDALRTLFDNTIYPVILVMDNAPSFKSRAMKRFAIQKGIKLCYLPPHASPYAGWIERSHQNILNGLRVLVASYPSKEWPSLLAEACQIVNSRPYQQDSDLCPLNLAYPNSEIPDPDRQTSNITELTEAAEMSHLNSVEPDTLPEYQERSNIRRKRQLKAYEYLFNKSRREIKERLSRTLPAATHALPPGSYARYYRPTLSKVKARWSPPCMIIDAKSSTTRVIRKPDGTHSTEWIGNLTPAPAPP
jgi:hypothetical protein